MLIARRRAPIYEKISNSLFRPVPRLFVEIKFINSYPHLSVTPFSWFDIYRHIPVLKIDGILTSWLWSYGSWIYNYNGNQCLTPLKLWVRNPIRWSVLDITLCDIVCQWLEIGRWFSIGTPVSSTNKTESRDIAEILLKVALNTITP